MKELKTLNLTTTFLFLLILPFTLFGQVNFNKIPIDKQLIARDQNTNLGAVIISGQVDKTATTYIALQIDVFEDGTLFKTVDQSLSYSGNLANFNFHIDIPAKLSKYNFKIYGKIGANLTLEETINDVVAGDVYIIQGQSNAVASIIDGSANGNLNDFIRVYSNGTDDETKLYANDNWYYGDGDGGINMNGNAGQWGLKLARMIVDAEKIPVAIFNGSRGAKRISYFLANNMEAAPSTTNNYERLKYRLEMTGLKDNVKAVFWSHGENAGGITSVNDYKNAFLSLRSSWLSDFSGIEEFYIFQTINGCGTPIESLMLNKEAQRQVVVEKADVHIMTTDGLVQYFENTSSYDYCHFVYANGYEGFATRINELVKRDFYGVNPTSEIEPPMIKEAYLSNHTTLVVETDASSLKISNSVVKENYQLANAGGAVINSISVSANKIIFDLSKNPGSSASISYLGAKEGVHDNLISNTNDLELVCFYKFPVSVPVNIASVWNGSSWSPSAPGPADNAIIRGDYDAGDGKILAKNLTIEPGVILNFNKSSTKSVILYGNLTIDGTFIIGDDESLVMYDDNAIIAGNLTKTESSNPRINKNDLTYWSSSITNADIATVFKGVSPNRIFYYDQSRSSASDPDNDPSGTYWDVWVVATGKMIPGVGYAAEGPTGETGIHKISFTGAPNNGKINVPLKGNFNDNDLLNDFNLIGNPYPSAVDIDMFISENSTVIDPTIYLWAHNTSLVGEDHSSSNYIAYNNLGGTAVSSDGLSLFFNNIHSGQGFFVRALNTGNVNFNNSMRKEDGNNQYVDADGDGYNSLVDCDDTDAAVNPGATEILYNGIDDDCNPDTLDTIDNDGDGFDSNVDCDDNNASIYPGAIEIPNNGINEDCDGVDGIDNGGNCTNDISGKLNIEPSKSDKNIFIMDTPQGVIDMNTLKTSGSDYSYSGNATSVKIKAKGHGNKLTVNGTEIKLEKNIRYEFTGDLHVVLVNEKARGNGNGGEGHWWINLDGSDICINPKIGNDCGNEVTGNLNIEPKKGKKDMFTMETSSGTIDMKILEKKDSDFTYTGNASSVKIKVNKKNSSLIVNGNEIKLDKKHRYEFTGELSVSLVNDKKKNGKKEKDHWWISISGNDICIVLDKKSKHDKDDDDDDDDDDDNDDDDDDDDDDKLVGSKIGSNHNNNGIGQDSKEERDLIWLDLITNRGGFNQILIGFTEKATDGVDKGYDALKMMVGNNPIDFYSSLQNKKYVIQGLSSFNEEKKVNLGFSTNVKPRTITLSINKLEGSQIENKNIYLEDHFLGITHDLSSEDYEFEQNSTGSFPDRFTLKFVNDPSTTLAVDELDTNKLTFIPNSEGYTVYAKNSVSKVRIYDLLGRNLIYAEPKSKEFNLNTSHINNGAILLIEIIFENGIILNKKLIKY